MTDAANAVSYEVAIAYSYGRIDCPERSGGYVPSSDFADRAVKDGVTVGGLLALYQQMLSERVQAGG